MSDTSKGWDPKNPKEPTSLGKSVTLVSYQTSRKFKIEDDGESRTFEATGEVENSIVLDIDGKFLRVRVDPADMLSLATTIKGVPPIAVMSIQEEYSTRIRKVQR